MDDATTRVIITALALAVGFAAGRFTAPNEPDEYAPPVGSAEPLVAKTEFPERPERLPAPRAHEPANAARCQDAELELRFLKARREASKEREQEIRRSFEEGTDKEEAAAWMSLAEQVIAQCLPKSLQLSFMECSEYPCVAAFAGPTDADEDARAELEFTASEALESCAPLIEAFGQGYPIDAATFLPFPASCPEGEYEHAWLMLLLDPRGDALHDLRADPDDPLEDARINRWVYRRANDVDRKWICEGEREAAP